MCLIICGNLPHVLSEDFISLQAQLHAPTAAVSTPTEALLEDAALRDVVYATDKILWAIGDQNTVLRSEDGGDSWQTVTIPIRGHWRSISTLTRQTIWLAGVEVQAETDKTVAIMIRSEDGGQTWNKINLPSGIQEICKLHIDKGQHEGFAVSTSTQMTPSGMIKCEDDLDFWEVEATEVGQEWRGAAFDDAQGVLVGRHGKVIAWNSGTFAESGVKTLGPTHFEAAAIDMHQQLWIVGNEGAILTSSSGGLNWIAPTGSLPSAVRKLMDLKTITTAGEADVWCAGSPGSVIWHSPDGGQNWQGQLSPSSATLRKITFLDQKRGIAVGDLGTILKTSDAGKNWNIVRGKNRRIAMSSFYSTPDDVSAMLLTKYGLHNGYRVSLQLMNRRDAGNEIEAFGHDDLNAQNAFLTAGGVCFSQENQFALDQPEIERNANNLLERWNRQSDGYAAQNMLKRIVVSLRSQRPLFVISKQPTTDSGANWLIQQALNKAIELAADENAYPEEMMLLNLPPWKIKRHYVQTPPQVTGSIKMDPFDPLPLLDSTLESASLTSRTLFSRKPVFTTACEYYVLSNTTDEQTAAFQQAVDFFAGYAVSPGTETRRQINLVDTKDSQDAAQKALRIQQLTHISEQNAEDSVKAAQLYSDIEQLTQKMSAKQAAEYLERTWSQYLQQGHIELAISLAKELEVRYPQSPSNARVKLWRFQTLASEEIATIRLKQHQRSQLSTKVEMRQSPSDALQDSIVQVSGHQEKSDAEIQKIVDQLIPAEFRNNQKAREIVEKRVRAEFKTQRVNTTTQSSATQQVTQVKNLVPNLTEQEAWQKESMDMAMAWKKAKADCYITPEVQLPLVSVLRKRGRDDLSEELLHREYFMQNPTWRSTAKGELWCLRPINVPTVNMVTVPRVKNRPNLDGDLSDECWEDARQIPMTTTAGTLEDPAPNSKEQICWWCYDHEFLFISGVFTLTSDEQSATQAPIETALGRQHDFPMAGKPRLQIMLDVDRDYATSYQFEVEMSGQTRESCAQIQKWNPNWFVAHKAEGNQVRLEIAIPLEELTYRKIYKGETWVGQVSFIQPGQIITSWNHPPSVEPRPQSMGLIRFD